MLSHPLELQIASTSKKIPDPVLIQHWVDTALAIQTIPLEVVLRVVDVAEMTELNQTYRHKIGPTNILSFPFAAPEGVELNILGDLAVCAPIVEIEANQQGKLLEHHWAHIVVHGIFHLLGYDHVDDVDAEEMEALEIKILHQLHIRNPYEEQ